MDQAPSNALSSVLVKESHLFLSASGEMLPRWQQAFPMALPERTDDIKQKQKNFQSPIVWLRLQEGRCVAEQISLVRQSIGECRVVVLSDVPNDDQALEAFSAAARGYCNSHATAEILIQVSTVVLQGGLWIGEQLMQRLLSVTNNIPVIAVPPAASAAPNGVNEEKTRWGDGLTEREREVARKVATGASNREIAAQLGITERTVKAHVGAILEKLALRDRLQLGLLVSADKRS